MRDPMGLEEHVAQAGASGMTGCAAEIAAAQLESSQIVKTCRILY